MDFVFPKIGKGKEHICKMKTIYLIIGIIITLLILSIFLLQNSLEITGEVVKATPTEELKKIEVELLSDTIIEEDKVIEILTEEIVVEPEKDTFLVTRVIDGDTIEIETGERVRLTCIDTPETYEDKYKEAKDYLTELILNEEVKLVKDVSETGKYGRLIRYIYLEDGSFVNELIVRNGYGIAYLYRPDVKLCPIIQEAEDYARINKLGIWDVTLVEKETLGKYDCSSNVYNCDDFSSHNQAQAVFEACLPGDIHQLDRDEDGLACESLP